jgi:hypothetical protein
LPLGRTGGYNFNYFIKGSLFTKSYILTKLENIPLANAYLPDGINRNSLSRNFLLTVSRIYNFLGASNGQPRNMARNVWGI